MIPLILRVMALEAAMMGRRRGDQASLFYEFRLDDRIPKDHLLRRIDGFVTALWTRFAVHGSTVIIEIVDDTLFAYLLMLRSPENGLRNKWCV